MRFSVAALLALASHALAQTTNDPDLSFDAIDLPNAGEVLPAGKPYTLKWTLKPTTPTGPVTIVLAGGSSAGTLRNLSIIDTKVSNDAGSYVWNVDSKLGDEAAYGIKIILESDPSKWAWSKGFKIQGSGNSGSSNSSSTSSSIIKTLPPTTTSSSSAPTGTVVVQTSTAIVEPNKTFTTSTPKPTNTQPGSYGTQVSVSLFALFGGVAFAVLGF